MSQLAPVFLLLLLPLSSHSTQSIRSKFHIAQCPSRTRLHALRPTPTPAMDPALIEEEDDNVCKAWTMDEDRQLLAMMQQRRTPVEVAATLKRGLQGCLARVKKMNDVNSSACLRLSDASSHPNSNPNPSISQKASIDAPTAPAPALRPFSDVLPRILYDDSLALSDFSFVYTDRSGCSNTNPNPNPNTNLLLRLHRQVYKGPRGEERRLGYNSVLSLLKIIHV